MYIGVIMTTRVKFSVGQLVNHLKFNYRGVVVDVDANYQGSEEWYDQVARSRPPKDKPWYHVLVNDTDRSTYVAERHLEADDSGQPIKHPAMDNYFNEFRNGVYRSRRSIN